MTKEITTLEKKVHPYITYAEELKIKDASGMSIAVDTLSKINKIHDDVIDEKEKVTKPLNEALKAERGRWKPIEQVCEEAIGLIRRKITEYQTAEKRRADEAAAKIAARVGEGKGKLKVDTAVAKIDAIDRPEEEVRTDAGKVKFQEVKCFEVMDVTMLPMEYLLPNEVMIRKSMKEGIEIPGVRYYTEQRPINFR